MQISSSAFSNEEAIPSKYTCDGENINPPLSFSDVPSEAQSLVLICDDPDAPAGTWVHWVMWNINSKRQLIYENETPSEAVQGLNSFGNNNYGGPCPPSGTHRYFFKLFALDIKLDISSDSKNTDVIAAMQGHVLAHAEFYGVYSKG